jgi:aspartate/methionine/tyrosine aminotransferase
MTMRISIKVIKAFELRQGMADFYENNYGVTLNSVTEILPLMGSKRGIMHISMAFLNEGDEY